jgi:hypothetical protein
MNARTILTISLVLFSTACASYMKRKECEKTNWFEYGQKVATRGQELEEDNFIGECRRAEAEISESALDLGFKKGRSIYCEPAGALATGKKGDVFSPKMCDGYSIKILTAKYNEGIRDYCDSSNGEPAGASGVTYKNVCPKDLAPGFLKGYKIGRKRYLSAVIDTKQNTINQLQLEILDMERDRAQAEHAAHIARSNATHIVRKTTVDPVSGARITKTETEQDPVKGMDADSKQRDADMIRGQIAAKRQEVSKVYAEIRELRVESETL